MIKTTQTLDDILIVSLQGSLEIAQQSRLKDDLSEKIPAGSARVVLDFAQVEFIDSACLGALISVAKKVRQKGGDMVIASLQDEVRSIFQITRLDKVFKIHDSQSEAITSFSK